MKNKKLCTVVIGMAMLANLGIVSMASAVDNQADQAITGTSGPTLIGVAPQNFVSKTTSTSSQSSVQTIAGNGVEFSDFGANTGAFNITVSATDFYAVRNGYFSSMNYTALAITTDSDDTLTAIAGSDCSAAGAPYNSTIANASPSGFADATDTGANGAVFNDGSDAKTLINFTAKNRVMQCQMNPQMTLSIPARQVADTYRSTLTFTLNIL